VNLGSLWRQTGIRLNRRFRNAQGFTVESEAVEAANASLPGCEHRAGIFDPARARLWLLGRGDPVDPISALDGRDVRPQRPRKEPDISACARGEFEACLEQKQI